MLPTSISLCVSINISILSTFCYTHSHTMLQTHGKMSFSFKCMSVELLSFLLLVKTSVATTNLCTTTYTNAVLFYYSLFRKKERFTDTDTLTYTQHTTRCVFCACLFSLCLLFNVLFRFQFPFHYCTHTHTFRPSPSMSSLVQMKWTQIHTQWEHMCVYYAIHNYKQK